jgi:hypothetical protein
MPLLLAPPFAAGLFASQTNKAPFWLSVQPRLVYNETNEAFSRNIDSCVPVATLPVLGGLATNLLPRYAFTTVQSTQVSWRA